MSGRAVILVLILGVTLPLSAASGQAGSDLAAREWNQALGNERRTSSVDVAPIMGEPAVAWRKTFPGKVLAGPVTWAGTVFVVVGPEAKRKLLAIKAQTGEVLASKKLKKGEAGRKVHLASWQGTAILSEPGLLHGYRHKGKSFSQAFKVKGEWAGPPCVHRGRILANGGGKLHVLDAKNGRELASSYGGMGMVAIEERAGRPPAAVTIHVGEAADSSDLEANLVRIPVPGLTGKKPKIKTSKNIWLGPLAGGTSLDDADQIRMARFGGRSGSWLVTAKCGFKGEGGTDPGCVVPDGDGYASAGSLIATDVAVHEGLAYGFTEAGELIKMMSDGSYYPVVEKADLPSGARPGPPSIARGVIVFGNWAVELESGRVLWCLPDLRPASPAVPAADGLLVVVTKKGELIGLADSSRSAEPTADASSPDGACDRAPDVPEDGDGVLLLDGRQLLGTFELKPGGVVRIVPAKGKPLEVPESDVALATKDGKVVLAGEEHEVAGIWLDALSAGCLACMEELYDSYLRAGLLSEGRRLLREARDFGLAEAEAESWQRRLSGRRDNPSDQVKKNLAKREEKARSKAVGHYLAGSDWCAKRGLGGAASMLLAVGERLRPGLPEVEKRAKEFIPPGFPWAEEDGAGKKWITWADEIVPAGAEFLAPDDPAWGRMTKEVWRKEAIAFRTGHLLLFSRAKDLEAVGGCLRNGEGTVRALAGLLKGGKASVAVNDSERLEIRVFKDYQEYKAEQGEIAEFAAGYYMPTEKVSRFYVPRESVTATPMGRDLYSVLAHELTHQYVEERWVGRDNASYVSQGYWVVEGLARFVEDQFLEMGRRGQRMDDKTVSSLDASARLSKQGALIDMRRFLGLDASAFHRLDIQPRVTVELKNTLRAYMMSEMHIFYDQAGSLVFFLIHGAGPEKRKAFIEYVRRYYSGGTTSEPWKQLGYASLTELDRAYRAFLAGL